MTAPIGLQLQHGAGQLHTGVQRNALKTGVVKPIALRTQYQVGLAAHGTHGRRKLSQCRGIDEMH